MKQSQNEAILSHLAGGGRLTPLDALRAYGCGRLGARIYELRQLGYHIQQDMVWVGTAAGTAARVAQYFMENQILA
jgi:hypothetical protein